MLSNDIYWAYWVNVDIRMKIDVQFVTISRLQDKQYSLGFRGNKNC